MSSDAASATERQTCPLRMGEIGPWEYAEGLDAWTTGHGLIGQDQVGASCSFCGSLNPDRFMQLVREGWIVDPTDKGYKAYLESPLTDDQPAAKRQRWMIGEQSAKFYFQHLSDEQRTEFIDLVNSGQMRIGYPGGFYRLPFFAKSAAGGA